MHFKEILDILAQISQVVWVGIAGYAAFAWKTQKYREDKYEALKDIKQNASKFKRFYQESRAYNQDGRVLIQGFDPHNLPLLQDFLVANKAFYDERLKILGSHFFKLKDSIDYYRSLHNDKNKFLDSEENLLLHMVQNLELCVRKFNDNEVEKKILLKSPDETDDFSNQLNKTISDIFSKCKQ